MMFFRFFAGVEYRTGGFTKLVCPLFSQGTEIRAAVLATRISLGKGEILLEKP